MTIASLPLVIVVLPSRSLLILHAIKEALHYLSVGLVMLLCLLQQTSKHISIVLGPNLNNLHHFIKTVAGSAILCCYEFRGLVMTTRYTQKITN